MKNFRDFNLSTAWTKSLWKQNITEPTSVQEKVIPVFLEGRDVFAQAQTGSGKTLAFLLPILQNLDRDSSEVQALIVSPTRELAIQIHAEIEKLVEFVPEIKALAVYGGQDVEQQIRKSKRGAQIIVATPGRLLDHMRRGTINLDSVEKFILDEADEMLRMGFLPEVQQIIDAVPANIQTALFSATLSEEVRKLALSFMSDPVDIRVEPKQKVVKTVDQRLVETTDRKKFDTLCELLKEEQPFLAVIFCRTKRRAAKLNGQLQEKRYLSDELHGDLSQAKRERVMKDFRHAKLQYLVATDVAARGLDVEGVTHVFNYDIPHDLDSYIHRIGRTGRAGEQGVAITLFSSKDMEFVEMIKKGIPSKIKTARME